MEGIEEMFEEFSKPSEFQLQFAFETYAYLAKEPQRRHDEQPARKEYKRRWVSAYVKRRRAEDPEWAAKLRERQNRINREYRERKRQQGKCARCPAPRADGKSMCDRHLEWERERATRRAA